MSRLRQVGKGSSSILQAQMPVVAAIKINYSYSVSTSEQTKVCEYKENTMRKKCIVTTKTGKKYISINAKLKLSVIASALLVFGYGDGFSPSALVYSI